MGGQQLRSLRESGERLLIRTKRRVLVIALVVGLFNILPAQAALAPKQSALMMHPKAFAKMRVMQKWNSSKEYGCLVKLWNRESHWNYKSRNKQPVYQIRKGKRVALHAFGIAQVLGEKSKIPTVQVERGLKYIESRYGTPCKSLNWHYRNNWY